MQEIVGTDIYLTRGDTGYLDLYIRNPETRQAYELVEGDTLVFTMRRSKRHPIVLQKELEGNFLKIDPEDTETLEFGDYVYDIELTFANGDVDTVIPTSKFRLLDEVTY